MVSFRFVLSRVCVFLYSLGPRKQLSKMGRNKACELDNLLIEAIIMVAELNLLLKDYTAENNGKWYPR